MDTLLDELGLTSVKNNLIGSLSRKSLSGGEWKRVAIGIELISDPSIILFDEPTSGLDSFRALSIIKIMNWLAKQGKTIISTIH